MIVGIRTVGVTETDVRRAIAWAIDRNEAYFREDPSRRPLVGVTYLPDPIADRVLIVCADAMGGPVSCGSAAAAMAGWQRAQDRHSYVRLSKRAPGVWHAYVETPTATPRIWDPAVELLPAHAGMRMY